MIKRTLLLGKPMYVRTELEQLVLELDEHATRRPIEDLGFVVVEHPRVRFSTPALQKLAASNVAVVFCGADYHPTSMLLPMDQHYTSGENTRAQVAASKPLNKQLWQQTVKVKLRAQAQALDIVCDGGAPLRRIAKRVRSGDPDNLEAEGARRYWPALFRDRVDRFTRDRMGESPNELLNYGYSILRSATARALVGAGLHPTFGIHHHNKYNAFCLADDLMEPYRPAVDLLVAQMMRRGEGGDGVIDTRHKKALLQVTQLEVEQGGTRGSLMVALQRSAWTLAGCFVGTHNQISYPERIWTARYL